VNAGLPAWFDRGVRAANLAVVGFGASGLLLAIAGVFRSWSALPAGAIATAVLVRTGDHTPNRPTNPSLPTTRTVSNDPREKPSNHRAAADQEHGFERPPRETVQSLRGRSATLAAHLAAVAVLAIVAAGSVYALRHRSEHVAINRDPGFYVNTARWLARDGGLEVDAATGPFEGASSLAYEIPGTYDRGEGRLHFQGNHLLPVVMADGHFVAGDAGLLAIPIALAALAVLSVYAFLASRTSALAALAVSTAFSGSLLLVAFGRDAYPEVPSLALLAFALSRLPVHGGPPSDAFAVGVALGALVALRIDAPLLLLLWPSIVGSWWFGANRRLDAARATRRIVAGVALTGGAGLLDLALRSPEYVSSLQGRTTTLWVAVALSVAAAAVTIRWRGARDAVTGARPRLRSASAVRAAAAVVFVALALAIWFVRPVVETVRGSAEEGVATVQRIQGIEIDPTRKYSEDSFAWQGWYLGAPLVAAGIAGIALAVARRSWSVRFGPLLATAAPASVLYLYRPNIFPDHAWVMRRYLSTLTFALLAGAAISIAAFPALVARVRRGGRSAAALAMVALAVCIAIPPLWATRPARAAADQHGYLGAVEVACGTLGDGAVIVMKNDETELHKLVSQALRGFCGVPVALAGRTLTPSALRALTRAWEAEGRVLHLVASSRADVGAICAAAPPTTVVAVNRFLLEQTLTRRPRGYSEQSLEFAIFDTRDCGGRGAEPRYDEPLTGGRVPDVRP
jgi:hypothetical protein